MKTPRWRSLAALLLLAQPLAAQVVTGRVASPITATPIIVHSLSAAAAAPSISAPSLLISPLAQIHAAPTVSIVAAPVAASAQATLSAAANGIADAPKNSAPGEDSTAGSHGRVVFDGAGQLVSQHGAVFVPTSQSRSDARRSVRFVQATQAPLAAIRPVPGTEGLSGKELLDKVSQIAAKNQHVVDPETAYRSASQYIFKTADHVIVGGVSGVVDSYSGIFVPGNSGSGGDYPGKGDQDGDGYPERDGMNIEHTWPQSLFNKALPMRADIHHLMATFIHPNGERGTLPYGEVKGTPDYKNNAGAKRGGGFFEPPDMTKGRVARALLYFYSRYKDSSFMNGNSTRFWNVQIDTMLRWNKQFPPDTQEMRRNDLVEQYQGNRNPFVDDPGLADRIGADALRAGRNPAMSRMSITRRSDVKRGRSPQYGRPVRR